MRRAVCQLLFYLTYCAKKYRHVSQLGLSDLWRELKLLKSTMFRAKSESYLFADLFKNVETAVYVNLDKGIRDILRSSDRDLDHLHNQILA